MADSTDRRDGGRATSAGRVALCALAGVLALTGAPLDVRGQEAEAPVMPADAWPFGKAAETRSMMGLDLYNLGLLGAKAGDASVPREEPSAPVGGKQSRSRSFPGRDVGPEGLRVDILVEKGPADRAGVRSGDVIVGVGDLSFGAVTTTGGGPAPEPEPEDAESGDDDPFGLGKKPGRRKPPETTHRGSLAPLARALVAAENGEEKGVVTLQIRRPGEAELLRIPVRIPKGKKGAEEPTEGAGRDRIVDDALAFLAERQRGDGGYPETLSGLNGSVAKTALAGLCWLGAGSDLKRGKYAKNVRSAFGFIEANLDAIENKREVAGASMDQSNWGRSYAAIFLGELHLRSPNGKVKDALFAAAEKLVAYQEASGGWAHGPGGKNPLDYLELNIVTGLALSGLGLAKQNGFEVPQDCLDRAEAYLVASSTDGGIGYSSSPGHRGEGNIGRTAGAWLGYVALGLGKREWCQKMGTWVEQNAGDVLGGHASLMQHVMLAGVAAHARGGDARNAFWESARRDFVLARSLDGSLQPRPWHESIGSRNTDVTYGDVWSTCAWTLPLVTEPAQNGKRPGLPGWSGRNLEDAK